MMKPLPPNNNKRISVHLYNVVVVIFTLLLLHSAATGSVVSVVAAEEDDDAATVIEKTTCSNNNKNNNDGDGACLATTNYNNNNIRPITVTFINKSSYRADIHYDDGRFGKLVGTVHESKKSDDSPPAQVMTISSHVGHRFFVTLHGVRESLVDPTTDEQYFFTIHDNNDSNNNNNQEEEGGVVEFILPENAAPSQTLCKDRYPICVTEAARGECTNNPGWMIVNCCKSCDDMEGYGHLIDSKIRCNPERLNSTIPAWTSGDLNKLFESWATNPKYKQYDPHVISSPNNSNKIHEGSEEEVVANGPWIMTFDNFINDYEIRQLLHGASFGDGFQRSTDQGKIISGSGEMVKVTSQSRTSSNAWCRPECEDLPGVKRVTKRIEEVTGIPSNNYESFQILQYEEGQFYRTHHDSSGKKDGATGHRILTFFLYLNDVEFGGETSFTSLDISVKPKKGRALIWPSVLDEDPDASDTRMFHEAKAVIKGTKYAANHWIHQNDFRNANLWGCNGSFA